MPVSAWPARPWAGWRNPRRRSRACWRSAPTTRRPTSIEVSSSGPWETGGRRWRISSAPSVSTIRWPRPARTSPPCWSNSAVRTKRCRTVTRPSRCGPTWSRPGSRSAMHSSSWAVRWMPGPPSATPSGSTRSAAQAASGIGTIIRSAWTSGMRAWPGSVGRSSSSRGRSSTCDSSRKRPPPGDSMPRRRRAANGSSSWCPMMRPRTTASARSLHLRRPARRGPAALPGRPSGSEPGLAPAHFNLGLWHEEMGERADAETRFRTAVRVDPAHATALARLASLLARACRRRNSPPWTDCSASRTCRRWIGSSSCSPSARSSTHAASIRRPPNGCSRPMRWPSSNSSCRDVPMTRTNIASSSIT